MRGGAIGLRNSSVFSASSAYSEKLHLQYELFANTFAARFPNSGFPKHRLFSSEVRTGKMRTKRAFEQGDRMTVSYEVSSERRH
jgi:hypothetical protein